VSGSGGERAGAEVGQATSEYDRMAISGPAFDAVAIPANLENHILYLHFGCCTTTE
jgi:hypothetical protein